MAIVEDFDRAIERCQQAAHEFPKGSPEPMQEMFSLASNATLLPPAHLLWLAATFFKNALEYPLCRPPAGSQSLGRRYSSPSLLWRAPSTATRPFGVGGQRGY